MTAYRRHEVSTIPKILAIHQRKQSDIVFKDHDDMLQESIPLDATSLWLGPQSILLRSQILSTTDDDLEGVGW